MPVVSLRKNRMPGVERGELSLTQSYHWRMSPLSKIEEATVKRVLSAADVAATSVGEEPHS